MKILDGDEAEHEMQRYLEVRVPWIKYEINGGIKTEYGCMLLSDQIYSAGEAREIELQIFRIMN